MAASSERHLGGVATPAECVSVCVVCEREGEANSDKLLMTGFAECRRSGTWRSMALPSARLEGTRQSFALPSVLGQHSTK